MTAKICFAGTAVNALIAFYFKETVSASIFVATGFLILVIAEKKGT